MGIRHDVMTSTRAIIDRMSATAAQHLRAINLFISLASFCNSFSSLNVGVSSLRIDLDTQNIALFTSKSNTRLISKTEKSIQISIIFDPPPKKEPEIKTVAENVLLVAFYS